MPQSKRVNKQEYLQRLDVVSGLQARGLSTMQVVRAICQQWDICERQALRYIKGAQKQEADFAQSPLQDHFSYLLSKYRFIYQQAVLLEDYHLSLRVMESFGNLMQRMRRDLTYETLQSGSASFPGTDELEALMGSLERPGRIDSAG